MRLRSVLTLLAVSLAVSSLGAAGCGGGIQEPTRAPLADKWLSRAKASYRNGDFDDARQAVTSALQTAPNDTEVRLLGARLALLRLDYAEAIKLTQGLQGTEAAGLRGRAHWYAGDLEAAADDLEGVLRDPSVKDPWARDISILARHGAGRHPYAIDGSVVGQVDMPRAGSALVVPCELEGEQILAMIATANGEVVVDSNSRREPAWVNLSFNGVEVRDVPARTQDLSGLSRVLGAPVKALIGASLLRHAHATFDRRGSQFVVRKQEPAAPPDSARVPFWYTPNGGLLMHATVSAKEDGKALLLVDSSQSYLVALNNPAWQKAGVDPKTVRPEPELQNMKTGSLPVFRLGTFDLPMLPAVQGIPNDTTKGVTDVELGGVLGAGLVALFRVTFSDEGRFAWLEPDPAMNPNAQHSAPPPSANPGQPAAPDATPAAKPGDKPLKLTPPKAAPPKAAPAPAGAKPDAAKGQPDKSDTKK
ncbi:tetratricopeptide repeat protein [Pendulispora albinea]|uniref:Tetratricopeptide repeat protein n=1 Tax=Pendulispora albinea TaxID=2741071 RepID=A0ABZ2LXB8_9BACT